MPGTSFDTSKAGLVPMPGPLNIGMLDIGKPFAFNTKQKVATNRVDKWVLSGDDHITVITSSGQVFVHMISGNEVHAAFQLAAPAPVAANPLDRFVFEVDDKFVVITGDGRVFVHDIIRQPLPPFGFGPPKAVSPARQIDGGVKVAANPQDEHVLLLPGKIVVISQSGTTFGHDLDLANGTIGAPYQFAPASMKVAANPQDEHLLGWNNVILVVTNKGEVFAHSVSGRTIDPPRQLTPGSIKVAALPQDEHVLSFPRRGELVVVTSGGLVFGHELFSSYPK